MHGHPFIWATFTFQNMFNDDFDDKLAYIYCFSHEKHFLDKNSEKQTLCNRVGVTLLWIIWQAKQC